MKFRRIVVVGASLAGLSAIEKLRALGYDRELVLIGCENELPYDRPPLSKQVLLGTWSPEKATLRPDTHYTDLSVELRLGMAAKALDLRARKVELESDDRVAFDGLIIATGAAPRSLPSGSDLQGVHMLRTLDDCKALQAVFADRPKLVVIGAGFIGGEVASTARSLGLDVTVIEAGLFPLARMAGPGMGRHFAQLHRDNGVDLRVGVGVSAFIGDGHVEGVRLSDGSIVPADVVVLGIGAEPCTEWMKASGLSIRDGVLCDQYCSAGPGIFAAGDVARWYDPTLGALTRLEHWTNAIEQGRAAAENLLSGPRGLKPYKPIPYVWSDQYGSKLQFLGRIFADDEENIQYDDRGCPRLLALYSRAGRITGAVTFNWPQMIGRCRQLIADGAGLDHARTVTAGAA